MFWAVKGCSVGKDKMTQTAGQWLRAGLDVPKLQRDQLARTDRGAPRPDDGSQVDRLA